MSTWCVFQLLATGRMCYFNCRKIIDSLHLVHACRQINLNLWSIKRGLYFVHFPSGKMPRRLLLLNPFSQTICHGLSCRRLPKIEKEAIVVSDSSWRNVCLLRPTENKKPEIEFYKHLQLKWITMKCTTTNSTKSTQCADERFLGWIFFSSPWSTHTHTHTITHTVNMSQLLKILFNLKLVWHSVMCQLENVCHFQFIV